MQIRAVKKTNISEQVFDQMKQLLVNQEWKQGEKIPSENELASMFEVSRVTVRNALQKLIALGLIETRLGEGSFVRKLDAGAVMNTLVPTAYLSNSTLETLEFRQVVETETAGLAASRATAQDIQELKQLLSKMEEVREDKELNAKADMDFHFKIAEITRNTLIIQTYHILREVLTVSMNTIVKAMGSEMGLRYHKKIIAAIEEGESKKAADIMREHIGMTIKRYKELQK